MTEFSSSEGALLGCFIVCKAQRLEPDVSRVQSGSGEPSGARRVSSLIEANFSQRGANAEWALRYGVL